MEIVDCKNTFSAVHTSRKRSARVSIVSRFNTFCLELLYICSSEKNMLFTGLGSVRIEKNCALGLECTNLQDLGHIFSLYGPPSR